MLNASTKLLKTFKASVHVIRARLTQNLIFPQLLLVLIQCDNRDDCTSVMNGIQFVSRSRLLLYLFTRKKC